MHNLISSSGYGPLLTGKILLIIFATLLLTFITGIVTRHLAAKLEKNRHKWDDLIIKAADKPIKILIWILGFALAVKITGDHLQSDFKIFATMAKNLAIIVSIGWFLWRLTQEYEKYLINKQHDKNIDLNTLAIATKLIKSLILIATSLMILQSLGINISGLLALGGIGGIAMGFASKDLLSNFFGGFTIYFDRPFFVGDWIRSPDRNIEGTVEYIGWRLTHIRTFDKRMLYVPNSIFSTIIIENASRMSNRRIYETITLRYDDMEKIAKIIEEIRYILKQHQDIDQNQTIMVNVDKFDSAAINFFIYCFTKSTDWQKFQETKQDILFKIGTIIKRDGGNICPLSSTTNIDLTLNAGDLEITAKK